LSAIITCSTAHSCRAFGLPRTCGAAKPVEGLVIGRMHGDELALQMGGQLGDLDAVFRATPVNSSQ
jgi:hypothetical protein